MYFKQLVKRYGETELQVVLHIGNYLVDSHGHKLILFHDREVKVWFIIDEYTGMEICHDKTKKAVISKYQERYETRYDELLQRGYSDRMKKAHKKLEDTKYE